MLHKEMTLSCDWKAGLTLCHCLFISSCMPGTLTLSYTETHLGYIRTISHPPGKKMKNSSYTSSFLDQESSRLTKNLNMVSVTKNIGKESTNE